MDGIVAVRLITWEKVRFILARRSHGPVDDKTVMLYILKQGNLLRENCKYGVFFDIDGENVILEV